MGGCSDINSCNADNNRTYQRKLLLEWRYNFSSITISMDLCRGKCIKRTTSSGEFAGFASGTPKEREKTGLLRQRSTYTFSPRFKKREIFILLELETEVNTSFIQLEAANFAPDEFMQVTFSIDEDHFYLKNLVCCRKKLMNAIQLAEQRKADQF